MSQVTLRSIAITSMLALLSACGGGGTDAPASTSTTQQSVSTTGTITGFGSVYVNGVRYESSGSTISVNGSAGTQSDLRVGHVVTVKGRRGDDGNGVADRITFDDAVKGPVQSLNATTNQLVVLGQTVLVDGDTSFDDNIATASLAGLTVGDLVEVSGLTRADGSIQATRIEKKPAGTMFEVTGRASNVDTATSKFNINALVVRYSAATPRDFPTGQPRNGDVIEAKGTSINTAGELVATLIEYKTDTTQSQANTETEIEGLVTRFSSATDFDVASKPITTNSSTRYENGTATDLALNVKVEVEGQTNANGVLLATKVQFKRQSSARIEARVDSVDVANNKFMTLGIEVNVNSVTRYEDKSDTRLTNFKLANLNPGDFVEVRGAELPAGSNKVTASGVERRRTGNEVELRGIVDTINRPSISILGVTIQTNGSTQFQNISDAAMTADAFFSAAAGQVVSAKGTIVGGVFTAREVSIESP